MQRLRITDYRALDATPEAVLAYGLAIRDQVDRMQDALDRSKGDK